MRRERREPRERRALPFLEVDLGGRPPAVAGDRPPKEDGVALPQTTVIGGRKKVRRAAMDLLAPPGL